LKRKGEGEIINTVHEDKGGWGVKRENAEEVERNKGYAEHIFCVSERQGHAEWM
jgi:hypothetical protein